MEILKLPNELLEIICFYTPPECQLSLRLVCRKLKSMVEMHNPHSLCLGFSMEPDKSNTFGLVIGNRSQIYGKLEPGEFIRSGLKCHYVTGSVLAKYYDNGLKFWLGRLKIFLSQGPNNSLEEEIFYKSLHAMLRFFERLVTLNRFDLIVRDYSLDRRYLRETVTLLNDSYLDFKVHLSVLGPNGGVAYPPREKIVFGDTFTSLEFSNNHNGNFEPWKWFDFSTDSKIYLIKVNSDRNKEQWWNFNKFLKWVAKCHSLQKLILSSARFYVKEAKPGRIPATHAIRFSDCIVEGSAENQIQCTANTLAIDDPDVIKFLKFTAPYTLLVFEKNNDQDLLYPVNVDLMALKTALGYTQALTLGLLSTMPYKLFQTEEFCNSAIKYLKFVIKGFHPEKLAVIKRLKHLESLKMFIHFNEPVQFEHTRHLVRKIDVFIKDLALSCPHLSLLQVYGPISVHRSLEKTHIQNIRQKWI